MFIPYIGKIKTELSSFPSIQEFAINYNANLVLHGIPIGVVAILNGSGNPLMLNSNDIAAITLGSLLQVELESLCLTAGKGGR